MIKNVKDKNEIIPLWQEAFGDSKEEIEFFLNNADYECKGIYINNVLSSMLLLFKCRLKDEDFNYIYAACTYNDFKKQGLMTELLDYCKKEYPSICLIPADEGLTDYYKKRGFVNDAKLSDIKFSESKEIQEWLFEGCNLKHPMVLYYKR